MIIDKSWRDDAVRPHLLAVLEMVNHSRRGAGIDGLEEAHRRAVGLLPGADFRWDGAESFVEEMFGSPSRRLAAYGSLAPGQVNAEVLDGVAGEWSEGNIRGDLVTVGWGQSIGFPGLTWNPDGPPVPVRLLTSAGLPGHWDRIDAFEGPDYVRILAPVDLPSITVVANVYEVRAPRSGEPGPAA